MLVYAAEQKTQVAFGLCTGYMETVNLLNML